MNMVNGAGPPKAHLKQDFLWRPRAPRRRQRARERGVVVAPAPEHSPFPPIATCYATPPAPLAPPILTPELAP